MQLVCVVVFLKILVRRTWLVLLLGTFAILPIAMSGTFAAEHLPLELTIAGLGIGLMFAVLLRYGLLALVVTFYTFLLIEAFPLTTDLARPYAGRSEEHTSELQSQSNLVCRLLLEKKKHI